MIKIKEINSYFNFLINDFGFSGPISYHYVHEMHDDFIREDMAVKLIYDGDYFCYLYKLKKTVNTQEFISGNKKLLNLRENMVKVYPCDLLDDNQRLWRTLPDHLQNKKLDYYAKLLKMNKEIFLGDFSKFSLHKRIIRSLKRNFKFLDNWIRGLF